jgi:hypothetical protein
MILSFCHRAIMSIGENNDRLTNGCHCRLVRQRVLFG